MEITNISSTEQELNETHTNGLFATVALFLIVFSSFCLHNLTMSLYQDSRRIDKLWAPPQEALFFIVPVYIFISLIATWLVAPKATQMRKIFKTASLIGIVLFIIYLLLVRLVFVISSQIKN